MEAWPGTATGSLAASSSRSSLPGLHGSPPPLFSCDRRAAGRSIPFDLGGGALLVTTVAPASGRGSTVSPRSMAAAGARISVALPAFGEPVRSPGAGALRVVRPKALRWTCRFPDGRRAHWRENDTQTSPSRQPDHARTDVARPQNPAVPGPPSPLQAPPGTAGPSRSPALDSIRADGPHEIRQLDTGTEHRSALRDESERRAHADPTTERRSRCNAAMAGARSGLVAFPE